MHIITGIAELLWDCLVAIFGIITLVLLEIYRVFRTIITNGLWWIALSMVASTWLVVSHF